MELIQEKETGQRIITEKPTGYRKVILVICWLAAATVYYSITQMSPLSPMIMENLGISKADMGILFSSPLLTFAIFAFFGGAISDRLGPRLIISLGISIVAVSAFCRGFMSVSYAGILFFNLLLGVGVGLALPNLPKLTAGWFPPAQRGWATSIYSTGINIGSSSGLLLTMPVAYRIAGQWNRVFFVWGILAFIIAVLVWLLVRNYPDYQKPDSSAKLFNKEVYSKKSIWILAAAFFWACWLFYSMIAWIPTIMHVKGVSAAAAGGFAAVVPITGVLAMIISPILSNIIRRRVVFIWGSYLIGILVVIGMVFSPINGFWVLLAITGFIINTPFVIAVFVIPADLVRKENLGAATGLIMTVGYFAALLGPWVSGRVWDITGNVTGVMISLIIAYAIGALIAFFIPEPLKRKTKTPQV